MKNTVHPNIVQQSIGSTTDGKAILQTEQFDDLVHSKVGIPDSVNFQERLMNFNIQIDGTMVNARTPYEFWLNDKFHHCCVNSFQLLKETDTWKIMYLINPRRKEDCHPTSN